MDNSLVEDKKVCSTCFKPVVAKNFSRHVKCHFDDKFSCTLCTFVCNRKDNYDRHLKTMHGRCLKTMLQPSPDESKPGTTNESSFIPDKEAAKWGIINF